MHFVSKLFRRSYNVKLREGFQISSVMYSDYMYVIKCGVSGSNFGIGFEFHF